MLFPVGTGTYITKLTVMPALLSISFFCLGCCVYISVYSLWAAKRIKRKVVDLKKPCCPVMHVVRLNLMDQGRCSKRDSFNKV